MDKRLTVHSLKVLFAPQGLFKSSERLDCFCNTLDEQVVGCSYLVWDAQHLPTALPLSSKLKRNGTARAAAAVKCTGTMYWTGELWFSI